MRPPGTLTAVPPAPLSERSQLSSLHALTTTYLHCHQGRLSSRPDILSSCLQGKGRLKSRRTGGGEHVAGAPYRFYSLRAAGVFLNLLSKTHDPSVD